jgi:hypothetical protein
MIRKFLTLIALLAVAGCISSTDYDPFVAAVDNQLESRSIQTRQINDTGYQPLMVAVISTLQDYHFRIIDINPDLGTITAHQLTSSVGRTALTVLIRQRGEGIFSVRMNMTTGLKADRDAELYQQFFSALQKKLRDGIA